MTYQVPLASVDGKLDLESLARRVARSCAHYFQARIHFCRFSGHAAHQCTE